MKLRGKWLIVVALGAALLAAGAGCMYDPVLPVPREFSRRDLPWPEPGPRDAENADGYDEKVKNIDWRGFTRDELITLVARTDTKFEKRLIGGLDRRISGEAFSELWRRTRYRGLVDFAPQQRQRLITVYRAQMNRGFFWGHGSRWSFGAKCDPQFTSELYLKYPSAVRWNWRPALEAFARAGRIKEAMALIGPYLNHPDEPTVCDALEMIGRRRLKSLADEVHKRTYSWRWLVRLQALDTLMELDDWRFLESLQRRREDVRRRSIGLRILSLREGFQARNRAYSVRRNLVAAMAQNRLPNSEQILEAIYLNRHEEALYLRVAAGHWLCRLDAARGLRATKLLLSRKATHDAATAIGVLATCEREGLLDADSMAELRTTLSQKVRALATARDVAGAIARELGAELIWRIAPASVPTLIKALKDEHTAIRRSAAVALARAGRQAAPAVPALVDALDDKDILLREKAVAALGRIGLPTEEAIARLARLLEGRSASNWRMPILAAEALILLGRGEQAMPVLIHGLNNDVDYVQIAAAKAVGRIGPRANEAIPHLQPLLRNHSHPEVRVAAAEALARLGRTDEMVPLLAQCVTCDTPQQLAAAWALDDLGKLAKAAVPALRKVSQDNNYDRDLREAAAEALKNIQQPKEQATTAASPAGKG